jgi:SAM-dependent methyltransferase
MKRKDAISWQSWITDGSYFDDLAVLGLGLFHPGGFEATRRLLSDGWWAGQTVLDVGCGNGSTLLLLQRIGAKGVGIEQSVYMREAAKRNGIPQSQVIAGRLEDIDSLTLPYLTFDAVIIEGVLGFISKPTEHLNKMVRLLAPNGRLYINDWVPSNVLPRSISEHGFRVFGDTDPRAIARALGNHGVRCKTQFYTTRTKLLQITSAEAYRRAHMFFPAAPAEELYAAVERKVVRMKQALPNGVSAEGFLLCGRKETSASQTSKRPSRGR